MTETNQRAHFGWSDLPDLDEYGSSYVLASPWTIVFRGVAIAVPPGARTDGATIPRVLWPFTGPPGSRPRVFVALVHDGMYEAASWCPSWIRRRDADLCYYEGLVGVGIGRTSAAVEYAAVRLFGRTHWTDRDD